MRLLAAELGEHGIRVNGINPDGVVRGSGIFAGGWGAQRAAVYGVDGGGARRVLRPAHPAQARGAARARRRRRLRAHRRRPDPHDGPARAGRRRRRRRLPPLMTRRPCGRTFAAVDLGASSGRVMVGRVGPDRARAAPRRTGSPTGRCALPGRCTGTCSGCTRASSTGCGRPAGRRPAGRRRHRHAGRSTTACSTPTARCSATRVHYRDARHADGGRRPCTPSCRAEELYRVNGLQHLPFNTRLPAGRRRGTPQLAAARRLLLIPDLLALLADRARGRRGHQRLDDRAARRRAPASGRRSSSTGSGCRAGAAARRRRPGRRLGELRDDVLRRDGPDRPGAGDRRRLARHRVGRRRRARPRAERFAYISCGTWSLVGVELDDAGADRGEPARPTSPTSCGVDGTVRYLRNVMGLWLLQESLRTWEPRACADLAELLAAAAQRAGLRRRRRPRRRRRSCRRATCRPASPRPAARTGQTAAAEPGRDRPLHPRQPRRWPTGAPSGGPRELSGRDVEVVHVVGGGRAQHAALPAHRRRLRAAGGGRPGGGGRARQRAGPGPAHGLVGDLRRCGACSPAPSGCAATSRARADPGRST